jgi:hypothetical protein
MLKYKILIKLYVLSCLFICCVYGDTIQAEVAVLCLLICCVYGDTIQVEVAVLYLLICCVYGDTIQAEVTVLCLLTALVLSHNAETFTSIKTSSIFPKFDGTILYKTKNMISGYK